MSETVQLFAPADPETEMGKLRWSFTVWNTSVDDIYDTGDLYSTGLAKFSLGIPQIKGLVVRSDLSTWSGQAFAFNDGSGAGSVFWQGSPLSPGGGSATLVFETPDLPGVLAYGQVLNAPGTENSNAAGQVVVPGPPYIDFAEQSGETFYSANPDGNPEYEYGLGQPDGAVLFNQGKAPALAAPFSTSLTLGQAATFLRGQLGGAAAADAEVASRGHTIRKTPPPNRLETTATEWLTPALSGKKRFAQVLAVKDLDGRDRLGGLFMWPQDISLSGYN